MRLFYSLLTRSHERRRDACIQPAPVAVGIRATLGVGGAAKEQESLLVAHWHLPPLEGSGLGVVPTHALELCHCEDSAPRLTNSLGLCYMDTYHGWLLSTPLSSSTTARSLFTGVRGSEVLLASCDWLSYAAHHRWDRTVRRRSTGR